MEKFVRNRYSNRQSFLIFRLPGKLSLGAPIIFLMAHPRVTALAQMLDHSLLHPTHTDADLRQACQVAIAHGVAAMCVKPYMLPPAAEWLRSSGVAVCCVIGFPAGNSRIAAKAFEAEDACRQGAQEVDMVINVAKALEQDWAYLREEIGTVTQACHAHGALTKVIVETDYVSDANTLRQLCEICTRAEADFVKTSTGFGFVKGKDGRYAYTGATLAHLRLMLASVGPGVRVKASGGVRTLDQLLAIQALGVHRCGTSATASLLQQAQAHFGGA
jgi:deoxyribose-phosphate aldolase